MDSNTHNAFIAGKGFSAFIDGLPDKCQHEWEGQPVHFITDKEGNETSLPDTHETPDKFFALVDELEKEGKWISGGAVTCALCNKIFSPSLY